MTAAAQSTAIPVNIITGFLGSGKTTLLQRLLTSPLVTNTAVLVNEFGEVGLDHHLLQGSTTPTLLMENGCVCCAIRGDLKDAMRDLFDQRERGEIPAFDRVVIETSGLADPAPIAYTVLAEPVLQHHFRLGNVVTVIDSVNGLAQLDQFEESVKQVAVADRLVLTKADLLDSSNAQVPAQLRERLIELNLAAPIIDAAQILDPSDLLVEDLHHPQGKAREADRWMSASGNEHAHQHTDGVSSFSLLFDQPMDWTAFGVWMTMLLNCHGDKVLRIKGMLNVAGVDTPLLINGVQHIVHPPVHLSQWPDADRRSRLVFIVHGIDRLQLEASLNTFNGLVPSVNETLAEHAA